MTRSSFQKGYVFTRVTEPGTVHIIRYRVRSADGKWRHKAEIVNTPRRKDAERSLAERLREVNRGLRLPVEITFAEYAAGTPYYLRCERHSDAAGEWRIASYAFGATDSTDWPAAPSENAADAAQPSQESDVSESPDNDTMAPVAALASYMAHVKGAVLPSVFADDGLVVENFAPYIFRGKNAAADWDAGYRGHAEERIKDRTFVFGVAHDFDRTGNRVYFVLPTTWRGIDQAVVRGTRDVVLRARREIAWANRRLRVKRPSYDVGSSVTWLGFRKENPAADCNYKLSFQRG
jgi:hypothetical protein